MLLTEREGNNAGTGGGSAEEEEEEEECFPDCVCTVVEVVAIIGTIPLSFHQSLACCWALPSSSGFLSAPSTT